MSYGKVKSTFWTDDKTGPLSNAGRVLALYLVTGPHRNILGAMRVPDAYIAGDLGWHGDAITDAIAELSACGFIVRDAQGWTHVVNQLKHDPPQVPNHWISALGFADAIPKSSPVFKSVACKLDEMFKGVDKVAAWLADAMPHAIVIPGPVLSCPEPVHSIPRQGANKNLPDPTQSEVPLAIEAWNELAKRFPRMPSVQRLTGARRAALAARLRESGGIVGWQAAIEKIAANPFLTGERPSKSNPNWRCTFDFLVSQRGFTRVMEGNYDDHTADDSQSTRSRENAAILEGLGLKPDEQRGAHTSGESGNGASGPLGRTTADDPRDTGDPGGGDSQAGGLGQGVQRAGERPENRRTGVQRSPVASAGRSSGGSVQIDQGEPPVGDEIAPAGRDSRDGERGDGRAAAADCQTGTGESMPLGGQHTTAAHGSGDREGGRDHAELAQQPGYDRDRELDDSVAWARQRA